MFSGTAQVPIRFVSFFVSSVCLLVRVTMVDYNKAVVCCLPATSAIMLSEKKKRKRNGNDLYASMNARVASLVFILEDWVPWDDVIMVSAGKLRKLWDSLSELRSSLCERRLERTILWPALLPVKTADFTQFSRQVWRHTVKSLFNWECTGRLRWETGLEYSYDTWRTYNLAVIPRGRIKLWDLSQDGRGSIR
jgi:hypothetical protein